MQYPKLPIGRLLYHITTLLLMVVCFSCSDGEEAGVVTLSFSCSSNLTGTDRFAAEIDEINVYVFNSEGYFVDEYQAQTSGLKGGNTLEVNLSPGRYDFVVWGNLTHVYSVSSLVKGVTRFSECSVSIQQKGGMVDGDPTPLFYGTSYKVEIDPFASKRQVVPIEMLKNTLSVRVVMDGYPVENIDETSFSCVLTSVSGSIGFDNFPINNNRLTYLSKVDITDNKELVAEFILVKAKSEDMKNSRLIVSLQESQKQEEILNLSFPAILFPSSITGDLNLVDDIEIDIGLGKVQ